MSVSVNWYGAPLTNGNEIAPSRIGEGSAMAMELNILGPLEVSPAGRLTALRRAKERCLLAILAISPGEVMPSETLIHRVWDEDNPSATMVRTLQSYMSHVRDVLTEPDGTAYLETGSDGYRLTLERERIDVHRFLRLRGQGYAVAQSGDAEHAVLLLREAEALWRGPALAGMAGRWIAAMRKSFGEEQRSVIFERIRLELDLGRHAELTGELQRLSAQFPDDEQRTAYEMMALYRSGRQAEALSLFQELRDRLDEQGLEPGPGLFVLQQRILRHDPDLTVTAARKHSVPPRSGDTLPPRLRGFVGRADEIRALIGDDQSRPPLVKVIEGMGGVGKTALAVEVAWLLGSQYPDPPLYLNLQAHVPGQAPLGAAEALRQLLEVLGVPPAKAPRSMREMTALWQQELTRRRSVVILDDVPGRDAIAPVLPRGGECLVLITTRRHMADVQASLTLSLGVLPEADAIALFTRRQSARTRSAIPLPC